MNTRALNAACSFLSDWLDYQFGQTSLVGLNVALHHKNQVVLTKSLGYANLDKKAVLTPDHLFNIGSQSKMMTATAIMQLVQRGQLDLNHRATRYLPWLSRHSDPRVAAITIEQLLSHRAGLLRDGLQAQFWQLEEPFPSEPQLKAMVLKASIATGDLRYKYSNIGYALLGLIIEKASHSSYTDYAKTHIIEPLGLGSHPAFAPTFEEKIATGYTRPIKGQRLPVTTHIQTHTFNPVAGWYANAQDMCRFMAAHFSQDDFLLTSTNKVWLHTNHRSHWTPKDRRGKEYGSGFMVQNFGESTAIGHIGSFVGHRSCSFYDPVLELGIVVLANTKDTPVTLIARGIFSVLHFFLRNAAGRSSPEIDKLNIRLMNLWSTVQIIATPKKIVAARLGEWLPLLDIEELEQISPSMLRIVKADANASAYEFVTYHYQDNKIASVNYAGSILRPEKQFYSWLKNNWPSM